MEPDYTRLIENPYASLENWLYLNNLETEFEEGDAVALVGRWAAEMDAAELCGVLEFGQ